MSSPPPPRAASTSPRARAVSASPRPPRPFRVASWIRPLPPTAPRRIRLAPKPEWISAVASARSYELRHDWCRYCGATETSGWAPSPWGARKLCQTCYRAWRKEGTLDLSSFVAEPRRPLDVASCSEYEYLSRPESRSAASSTPTSAFDDDRVAVDLFDGDARFDLSTSCEYCIYARGEPCACVPA